MKKELQNISVEFFEKLWISYDSIEVKNDDDSNIFNISIQSNESWLLIWPNWKHLDALQAILKQIISHRVWKKIKIHLEVNDYIKSKDDRLFDFIKSKVEYVKKSKKDFCLPYYWAYDRKKIHWYISELNESTISTKSIWEWKERRLHIFIHERKLELDIDWDDI